MKMGLKSAVRVWGYHGLLLLVGLFFISNISQDWVSIGLNVLLVLGGLLMCFNEGAYSGEKACTMTASLEKQMKEGRHIDDALRAQVFNKKVAAWILIISAAPFLLLSAVNAITSPFYPEVRTDLAVEEAAQETPGDFAFARETEEEAAPVNPVNVVARLVFMPYVSVYSLVRGNVLNALFFLFSLLMPAITAVGYLQGPRLRNKKLHDIARGKKRKMKNLKVNKKPRQQKAEV